MVTTIPPDRGEYITNPPLRQVIFDFSNMPCYTPDMHLVTV